MEDVALGTDVKHLTSAIEHFERSLPGFWWSIRQFSTGAMASCSVDGSGSQSHLLDEIPTNSKGLMLDENGQRFEHPYNDGIHATIDHGSPSNAMLDVLIKTLEFMGPAASNPVAKGWDTDVDDFALAIMEFEKVLPAFQWSVGQCSVGAHASCSIDDAVLEDFNNRFPEVSRSEDGNLFKDGFHEDTQLGSPADALRSVMEQALTFMNDLEGNGSAPTGP